MFIKNQQGKKLCEIHRVLKNKKNNNKKKIKIFK